MGRGILSPHFETFSLYNKIETMEKDNFKTERKDMQMQQKVELVLWEDIRRDCKYPESDNNNGFVYGLNLLDEEAENEIVDVQWFETDEERFNFIEKNSLDVIN